MARCRFAIHLATLATRCDREPHEDATHEGPGLFDYQRLQWFSGDSREFITDHDEPRAWEV